MHRLRMATLRIVFSLVQEVREGIGLDFFFRKYVITMPFKLYRWVLSGVKFGYPFFCWEAVFIIQLRPQQLSLSVPDV
jgi:hypothetical protein